MRKTKELNKTHTAQYISSDKPQRLIGCILLILPFAFSVFIDPSYWIGRQINSVDPVATTQIAFFAILIIITIGWILLSFNKKEKSPINIMKIIVPLPLLFVVYYLFNFAFNFAR